MMIVSAFLDALHSPDALIAIYEPTLAHVRTIALPKMAAFLTELGIAYKYNKQERYLETLDNQIGNFLFMSYEDPEMIVGFESYRSHIDELDVISEDKARLAWQKIIARNRQHPKGLPDEYKVLNPKLNRLEANNRVSVYSTPEGYKFTYKTWSVTNNPEYQYVKAKSRDNPYLPESYIQSLMDTYPEELLNAYLEGEWRNMNNGSVYYGYNREAHESQEMIFPGETLFIGCDFNVQHMAATVWVKRDGGNQWHAVAELTEMYDTPAMIDLIRQRWHQKGHTVVMYPDASGAARKTVSASQSDIALLTEAGFHVRAHKKNPGVADRIQAVNTAFSKGRLFVNTRLCPVVARCLEQQAYNKNGEPDKTSGVDHQNDATSYPIAYEMPIRKPIYTIDFSFARKD
jgi:hypothetical protein